MTGLKYLITSQAVAGILAIFILYFLFTESQSLRETIAADGFSPCKATILEFLLAFILMFVIINVSTESKEIGTMVAIVKGGVILLKAMFAGPMTKTSMNPVRSIAPALFTGNFQYPWLYIVAPILGALTTVSSCKLAKNKQCLNFI